jgi:hypothetical protein
MFCLVLFLMHVLHIRLVMVPDMCHRLPNDAKLAMQESGHVDLRAAAHSHLQPTLGALELLSMGTRNSVGTQRVRRI